MDRILGIASQLMNSLALALLVLSLLFVPTNAAKASAGCDPACRCSVVPCPDDICSGVDGCAANCDCVANGTGCKCQ